MVGLVSVPVILVCEVPAAPPVIPPVTTGADHVYVVPVGTILPVTPLTGLTVNTLSLQDEVVCVLTNGFGFTVTVIVNVDPTQFPVSPEVGVTV